MKTFDINYYKGDRTFSHKYAETWEKTDYYCLCCGEPKVWRDSSEGDYEAGPQHLCVACGATFNLPCGAEPSIQDQDLQRLEHLRGEEA